MDSGVNVSGEIGKLISFDTDAISTGIKITDHIERRQCWLETPQTVSPREIPTDEFHFPVDRGISITTDEVSFPYTMAVCIRNHSGFMIEELSKNKTREFPSDIYSIELSAPIKLYITIRSNFTIDVGSDNVTISFQEPTEIYLGARSHHERPAATISTTKNPEDIMKAMSFLSSALKTTTCERSYPTLRGHPPEINVTDRLQIPSVLQKPETGVTIEAPPDYQSIYILSPLAYYLGANVIPGEHPRIKTDNGFIYNLDNEGSSLDIIVEKCLKRFFFLDCITRTEGYYQVNLHERNQIESKIQLNFSSLYNDPVSKQIEQYLSVPYGKIKPHLPQWKQTVYIECLPDRVEILPFLLHDLPIIRSVEQTDANHIPQDNISKENMCDDANDEIDEFSRRNGVRTDFFRGSSQSHMNVRSKTDDMNTPDVYVQVPDTESFEEIWIGAGIPIGASKAMTKAFKNRLRRSPIDGDIDITVILNDEDMSQEGIIADEVYGSREQLPFTVNEYHQLTTKELHQALQKDSDFLHYIGHIDKNGFECLDGQLDVEKIDDVGADTFLLNACASYQQAIGLIEAGAIAGIATIKPVLDSGAERIGKALARLLNLGFPLIPALHIAKSQSIMGDNYVVIGDGNLNLTQAKSGIPSACEISRDGDVYKLKYITYLTRKRNMGTMTIPFVEDNEEYFLASGDTGEFEIGINELLRFLSEEELPIRKDSTLYWSDEISVSELAD